MHSHVYTHNVLFMSHIVCIHTHLHVYKMFIYMYSHVYTHRVLFMPHIICIHTLCEWARVRECVCTCASMRDLHPCKRVARHTPTYSYMPKQGDASRDPLEGHGSLLVGGGVVGPSGHCMWSPPPPLSPQPTTIPLYLWHCLYLVAFVYTLLCVLTHIQHAYTSNTQLLFVYTLVCVYTHIKHACTSIQLLFVYTLVCVDTHNTHHM